MYVIMSNKLFVFLVMIMIVFGVNVSSVKHGGRRLSRSIPNVVWELNPKSIRVLAGGTVMFRYEPKKEYRPIKTTECLLYEEFGNRVISKADLATIEGEEITLEEGHPDKVSIGIISTGGCYTLHTSVSSLSDRYWRIGAGEYGTHTGFNIDVVDLPYDHAETKTFIGKQVRIDCTMSLLTTLHYCRILNNMNQVVSHDCFYIINPVRKEHAGNWTCLMSHRESMEDVRFITSLDVQVPQGITICSSVPKTFRRNYMYHASTKKFYKVFKLPRTFQEAVNKCRGEGAELAVPKTKEEAMILNDMEPLIWVGLHDIFSKGVFMSPDGIKMDDVYKEWAKGEPNISDDNKEHCITMSSKQYNDRPCDKEYNFVCSKSEWQFQLNWPCEALNNKVPQDVTIPSSVPKTFRKDYMYHASTKKFYKAHKDILYTFEEAVKICRDEGAELAVPKTKEEAIILNNMCREKVSDECRIWIGLHDIYAEGNFVTLNGTKIDHVYNKWKTGEPNNNKQNENCVEIDQHNKYNDVNCSRTKDVFVCSKDESHVRYNKLCEIHDKDVHLESNIFTENSKTYLQCSLKNFWSKGISWCRAASPNGTTFLLLPGTIYGKYSAYGTSIENKVCSLEIDSMSSDDHGLWRIELGISADEYTGCIFTVPIKTQELDKSSLNKAPTQTVVKIGDNLRLECSVPWPSSYCYAIKPDGTSVMQSSIRELRPIQVGVCIITAKNISLQDAGRWICGLSSNDGSEDIHFYTDVKVLSDEFSPVDADLKLEPRDSAVLMCKSLLHRPLQYCRFVNPQKKGFSVIPNANNSESRYSYYGAGLEEGECGVKINKLQSSDFGSWICATTYVSHKQEEYATITLHNYNGLEHTDDK